MQCNIERKLTPAGWVCRLYSTSAAVLLVSLFVFSVISRNDTSRMVMLEYASNNRTVVLGTHAFNLSSGYTAGLLLAMVAHVVVALVPTLLHPHLAAGRNPARWIIMLLCAPLLQAVTLVGIAGVTDVWAVFAVASVSGLGLMMLFVLESGSHGPCTVFMMAAGIGSTFVGYWALIWRASGATDTFSLAICCGMTVLLITLFASTYNCRRQPYKREAVMQSTTLLFLVGMPWLWSLSSNSSTTTAETLGSFVLILLAGVACTTWAVISTGRIVDPTSMLNDHPTGTPLITDSEEEDGAETIVVDTR
mgnify:CR=1 FL=1|jgi:hypothetical protein|tara:strand:+ start:354 stop:1271 length:918 start_codon:yes stop_codon:yes gene_type:complete